MGSFACIIDAAGLIGFFFVVLCVFLLLCDDRWFFVLGNIGIIICVCVVYFRKGVAVQVSGCASLLLIMASLCCYFYYFIHHPI